MVAIGEDVQPMSRSTRKHVMPPSEPFLGVGHGEHHHEVGLVAAGDEDLLAVDDPVVAVAHRTGLDVARVGAGARLGDREAAVTFAVDRRDQVLRFCSSLAPYRMLSAVPPSLNGTNERPVSMAMMERITGPRSTPPYSSGVPMPQNPAALAFCWRSWACSGERPGRCSRSLRAPALERDDFLLHEGADGVAHHLLFVGKREIDHL
jgi:hypothetical protein